jgi:hypothetical protein
LVDNFHYCYGFVWSRNYREEKAQAIGTFEPFGQWMLKKLISMLPQNSFTIFIDSGKGYFSN